MHKERFSIPWDQQMQDGTWRHGAPLALYARQEIDINQVHQFVEWAKWSNNSTCCNNNAMIDMFSTHWRPTVQHVQLSIAPITHSKLDIYVTMAHNYGPHCSNNGHMMGSRINMLLDPLSLIALALNQAN